MTLNLKFGDKRTSFILKDESGYKDFAEKKSKNSQQLNDYYISKFAMMSQTHSDIIEEVNKPGIYKADGIITEKKDLRLTIQTADCMPVLLADDKKVGAIHIGWQGIENKIFHKAILKFDISKLKIIIGPHAKKCCYEVKEDLYIKFYEYCIRDKDNIFLDLTREIANFSKENNIKLNISDICTIHDERYFSFRRDSTKLRQLSQIWI